MAVRYRKHFRVVGDDEPTVIPMSEQEKADIMEKTATRTYDPVYRVLFQQALAWKRERDALRAENTTLKTQLGMEA